MKKAILFKKLSGKTVQCTACSHYCRIQKDRTGICGVRKNIDGDLYLLVYGLTAAIHIDPIEKKPLYHFLTGTEVLSFGTVGCNLSCTFCQNWQISQISKKPHAVISGIEYTPLEIVEFALTAGTPSIAYTYNEPGVFFEYAYDTMKLANKAGIKNIYVSNGYISKEARKKIKKYLDAANIDLKSFDDNFYSKICGGKLQPVLDSIEDFYKNGVHLELTTLVIPGENDDKKNLKDIANYIAGIDPQIPWHISRFFPDYKMRNKKPTAIKTLKEAQKIGQKAGLKHVYIGNV